MTDLIVAFDNEDAKLGVFFARCAEFLTDSLNGNWNCISVDSRSLNEVNLEIRAGQLKGSFVFASFTHGSESSLVASSGTFLQSPVQRNYLANSFCYCFACHSGRLLGRELVENGTHSFIGYSNVVTFVWGYVEVFASCAVEGIIHFKNGASITESLDQKKKKYTEEMDKLYVSDFVAASVLMDNRDCLVLHGDGELSNKDFTY